MAKHVISRRHFLEKALATSGYIITASSPLLAPLVHAMGELPEKLSAGQSIFKLQGKVSINGKTAVSSSKVPVNSVIETANDSQLIFVVGKDAHLLKANSKVIISGEGSDLETGLQVAKGKILSVFGKRKPHQPSHTIKTTTATIGIRGTAVYAESFPNHSYICTCYGETQIQANYDESSFESIQTEHHDMPRYIFAEGEKGNLIEKAPMKNHFDDELAMLEALVGRSLPFDIDEYLGI